MVNEYLREMHPLVPSWTSKRLGPVADPAEARMFSVLQRYADAVVIEPERVLIIEAKTIPDAGAIGQLEHYDDLFYQTPDMSAYWNMPSQLQLLSGWEDVTIQKLCQDKNIDFILYQPQWLKEYVYQRKGLRL
jgi:hypothetical protein